MRLAVLHLWIRHGCLSTPPEGVSRIIKWVLALAIHEQRSRSLLRHFVSEKWHETLLVSVIHWTFVKLGGTHQLSCEL